MVFEDAFREAVAAVDAGDLPQLDRLIAAHPALVRRRLESPGDWLRTQVGDAIDGFFSRPYLLWFVAEDPVRNGTLPANIAAVAHAIISAAERLGVPTLQEQLDYALQLVSWSWIANKEGVQLELIDLLLDAGASPAGAPENALVNGNRGAAEHLLVRGAPLTLAVAVALGLREEVPQLLQSAPEREKQMAFVLAALHGNVPGLQVMLQAGANVNEPSPDLQSHATPVHHAVSSGSLPAVQVLVAAGADLSTKDTAYGGTPLGWAEYAADSTDDPDKAVRYSEIAEYLRRVTSTDAA